MKGIVLAGGTGSRLYPTTLSTSKHLLPIYDKPCIYYPISTLMLAGIREILIVVTQRDLQSFKTLLGDGKRFGLDISYAIQSNPNGIAEALILAEDFLNGDDLILILGDNIFYGDELSSLLIKCKSYPKLGQVFSYHVANPTRFGVVALDEQGFPTSIEEKPKIPKSNLAVTGLYYYRNEVINLAKDLVPSNRGELEITDINNQLLYNKNLTVEKLGRGIAWLDIGTPSSLLEASQFIQTIQNRQGLKIACLEEISYNFSWLSMDKLKEAYENLSNTIYGEYIGKLIDKEQGVS
jgi:glucose-1-phosphate thymidylyltransferase